MNERRPYMTDQEDNFIICKNVCDKNKQQKHRGFVWDKPVEDFDCLFVLNFCQFADYL